MTKNDLEKSLRSYTRNGKSDWITINEICAATGKTRCSVSLIIKDLPVMGGGDHTNKTKKYFVPDVAKAIMKNLNRAI